METHHDDADELARAKESLLARMDELGKRFQTAKHTLDAGAHIAAHPILSVGVAFAAGILLGSHGARRFVVGAPASPTSPSTTAQRGVVATLLIALVKDFVVSHATEYAKSYLSAQKLSPHS